MNTALLKTLVDLSGGSNAETADIADVAQFFARYPDSAKTHSELKTLEALGYVSLLYADDELCSIGVNMKARKYFR